MKKGRFLQTDTKRKMGTELKTGDGDWIGLEME